MDGVSHLEDTVKCCYHKSSNTDDDDCDGSHPPLVVYIVLNSGHCSLTTFLPPLGRFSGY